MNQLPPPPPGSLPPQPSPWTPPATSTSALPAWRTARSGWVILHIVIGLGIGFGAIILAVMIVGAGHFDAYAASRIVRASRDANNLTPQAQRIVAAMGGASLIALASGVLAWLLFVYLRVRTSIRAVLLVAIPLAGALIGYGMMAAVFPKLAGY